MAGTRRAVISTKHQIVCPHCEAVNFVYGDKPLTLRGCGQCQRPLFSGKPMSLTAHSFETHLHDNDIPLLVDFSANWCAPCRVLGPIFDLAARTLEPEVRLAKVDTDVEPKLAGAHGIRGLPTVILFHHGHEVARRAGSMALNDLLSWTRTHCPSLS